jgi:hypothetical protein
MFRLLSVALTMLFVFGCNGSDQDAIADANRANATPPAQADAHDHAHAEAPAGGGIAGEVLETMDAGGYTYVLVKTSEGDVWAAGPQAPIAVGDHVDLGEGMLMPNFKSETLDRTFEKIYFVGAIASGEKAEKPAMTGGHGAVPAAETDIDLSDVSKADYTIAEMYALGADADGRAFAVRGRVVKANKNIMGTNWYHIQDGSETGAHGDLAITSSASLNVGDLVLITGSGTVDKDFGAGYRYELIIENADVTVESI